MTFNAAAAEARRSASAMPSPRSRLVGNDRNIETLAPHLELLDGGGAESVARGGCVHRGHRKSLLHYGRSGFHIAIFRALRSARDQQAFDRQISGNGVEKLPRLALVHGQDRHMLHHRAHRLDREGRGGIDDPCAGPPGNAGGIRLAVRLVLDQQCVTRPDPGQSGGDIGRLQRRVGARMDDDHVLGPGIQQDDRMARHLGVQLPDRRRTDAGMPQPFDHPVVAGPDRAQMMCHRPRPRRRDRLVRALAAKAKRMPGRCQGLARPGQAVQSVDVVDIDRAQIPDRHVVSSVMTSLAGVPRPVQ